MKRAILVFWVISISSSLPELKLLAQDKSIVNLQSIVLDIRKVVDAPKGEFRHRKSATVNDVLIEVFTWYDHECDLTYRDGQGSQHLQIFCNGRKWAEGAIDRLYMSPDGCNILLIEKHGNVVLISKVGERFLGRTLCLPRFVLRNGPNAQYHESIITELAVASVAWHSQSRAPVLLYEDGLLIEVDTNQGVVGRVLQPSRFEWRDAPADANGAISASMKRFIVDDRIELAYGASEISVARLISIDDSRYAIQDKEHLTVYEIGSLVPIVVEPCQWAFDLDRSTLVAVQVLDGVCIGKTVNVSPKKVVTGENTTNTAHVESGMIPVAVNRCNGCVVVFFSGGLAGRQKVAAWRWTADRTGEVIQIHNLGRGYGQRFECAQDFTRFTVHVLESNSWPCELSRTVHFEF